MVGCPRKWEGGWEEEEKEKSSWKEGGRLPAAGRLGLGGLGGGLVVMVVLWRLVLVVERTGVGSSGPSRSMAAAEGEREEEEVGRGLGEEGKGSKSLTTLGVVVVVMGAGRPKSSSSKEGLRREDEVERGVKPVPLLLT